MPPLTHFQSRSNDQVNPVAPPTGRDAEPRSGRGAGAPGSGLLQLSLCPEHRLPGGTVSLSFSAQDSPGCHFYFQCGSDGRNYQNECLFRCAQEKCPTKTRGVFIRRGMCEDQGDQWPSAFQPLDRNQIYIYISLWLNNIWYLIHKRDIGIFSNAVFLLFCWRLGLDLIPIGKLAWSRRTVWTYILAFIRTNNMISTWSLQTS